MAVEEEPREWETIAMYYASIQTNVCKKLLKWDYWGKSLSALVLPSESNEPLTIYILLFLGLWPSYRTMSDYKDFTQFIFYI